MIGIVRKLIAISLIFIGVIILLVGAGAILDPVGTQMANDNAPLATPPTLLSSLSFIFAGSVIAGVGVWVFRFRQKDVKPNDK